jgi:hypothetical protein
LIQSVLDDLNFNERTGTKNRPASSSVKLNCDIHGKEFNEDWSYQSVIGKLNFIEKSTRPDIMYTVHQCAHFSMDPKDLHATAVKRIGKYLLATKDKGMILNPKNHSFDCWVDADFVGNCDRVYADVDPGTAKSRAGFIITYGECPIVWGSKLMQEVALSTAEAEYGAISMSLRDFIFLMQLLEETTEVLKWEMSKEIPKIHCKLFEDNSGALEMARLPKMRPRTKHLCVKMHHFREYVRKGKVSVHKIPMRFQLGDIATKAQPEALFVSQRESLLQWEAEFMSAELLSLPAMHLRACGILETSKDLCEEQHAHAYNETLQQTVAKGIEPGIGPGIVPGNSMGQETGTIIGIKACDRARWIEPNVKIKFAPKSAPSAVMIGGKALQDWIKEKGFNGETTSRQRASARRGKGPFKRANIAPKGHLQK